MADLYVKDSKDVMSKMLQAILKSRRERFPLHSPTVSDLVREAVERLYRAEMRVAQAKAKKA